ncbi:hypothetical protein IMZ48_11095, partial [Candidatus Bathyarchaeota archaeon]|nr:hypothetical protein [Candidatus Bathyarchaeota archaeon]
VYNQPTASRTEETPEKPTETSTGGGTKVKDTSLNTELQRLAEESFFRHLKYGGDYTDDKPITGQPGNFHVASGRKEKPAASNKPTPPVLPKTDSGIGGLGLPGAGKIGEEKKEGKPGKSPRAGNAPKPKRKKSKTGATPTPTSA